MSSLWAWIMMKRAQLTFHSKQKYMQREDFTLLQEKILFLPDCVLSKQKVMIWTSIKAVQKCIKGSMDKRMLFSKTAGTLPVSSHNWVLQYLNYKLKIIFTGVILNIIWNFLTLPQPCYTTQLCSDLHVWCTWLKFCHITSWATKTHSINRRCNIWESKNI